MAINTVDVLLDSGDAGVTESVTGTRDYPLYRLNPEIRNCVGVSVISADVPFTYFVINASNQWFATCACSPTGVVDPQWRRHRRLTPGTYTPSEFVSHFNQVGLTLGYSNDWVEGAAERPNEGYAFGIRAFIDSTDGKLVLAMLKLVTTTPPGNLDYANYVGPDPNIALLIGTTSGLNRGAPASVPTGNGIAEILGFSPGVYYFTQNTGLRDNNETLLPATASALKAPKTVKLEGPGQMYLNSNLAGSVHGSVRNQLTMQPMIAFWPVNAQYQGTIDMIKEKPIVTPQTKATISKIDLYLTLGNKTLYGEAGKTTTYLQLNGESFRIGLRFYVEENESDTGEDDRGNIVMAMSSANYEKLDNPSRRMR